MCKSTLSGLDDVVYVLLVCSSETCSIVLADGETRHQLDMTKSAGLSFDMLLSSEILSLAKPDPTMYYKAAGLLKCKPEECVMVSAHHDDLITAKRVYVCYLSIQYTVSGIVDVMGC
jgi:FMN phosphatase YigB (HAD superfamily)